MKKSLLNSIILFVFSLFLTGCSLEGAGDFRIIGYNTEEDLKQKEIDERGDSHINPNYGDKEVHFETFGGEEIPAKKIGKGKNLSLKDIVPKKEGCYFIGWCKDPEFKTQIDTVYYSGQDVTIYAWFSEDVRGDICYLGHYPQSRVLNSTLIERLNAKASPYMLHDYEDVEYYGVKYRKTKSKITDETLNVHEGDICWFKFEPVPYKTSSRRDKIANLNCLYVLETIDYDIYKIYKNGYASWIEENFKPTSLSTHEIAGITYYGKHASSDLIPTDYAKYRGYNNLLWDDEYKDKLTVYNTETEALEEATGVIRAGFSPYMKDFDNCEKSKYTINLFNEFSEEYNGTIIYAYDRPGISSHFDLPTLTSKLKPYYEGDYRVSEDFKGWKNKETGKVYTAYNTSQGSVTLYATFETVKVVVESDIRYHANIPASSNPNEKTKIRPTEVYELQDWDVKNYEFQGWYLDSSYTKRVVTLSEIYNDIDLYAYFLPMKLYINYHLGTATNHEDNPEFIRYSTEQQRIELKPATLGYLTFVGWSFSESRGDLIYSTLIVEPGRDHDIDIYPIFEGTFEIRYKIDESQGEIFIPPINAENYYKQNYAEKYYYKQFSYEPGFTFTYNDLKFPSASKPHYKFNGWKNGDTFVKGSDVVSYENVTLYPDFEYVEYGSYLEYDLGHNFEFVDETKIITYIKEGETKKIYLPIDKYGHRFNIKITIDGRTQTYYNEASITGSSGAVRTYLISFESIHEGYLNHNTNHCAYCSSEIEGSLYEGTFTTGSTIKFGFTPLNLKEISQTNLPDNLIKPTLDDFGLWEEDLKHGGFEKFNYAHYDDLIDNGNDKRIKVRYVYSFELDKFYRFDYSSISWKVISVDTESKKAVLEPTKFIDYSIYSDKTARYDSSVNVEDVSYKYEDSYVRNYLNTTFIDSIFDEYEKVLLNKSSYVPSLYALDSNNKLSLYRNEEALTDYAYLRSYKDAIGDTSSLNQQGGHLGYSTLARIVNDNWFKVNNSYDIYSGYFNNINTRDIAYYKNPVGAKELTFNVLYYSISSRQWEWSLPNSPYTKIVSPYSLLPRINVNY